MVSVLLNPPPGVNANGGIRAVRGLISRWLFNEGGGQKIIDIGSINNGAAVNNPVSVPGAYGRAISFNGTNQYVQTGNVNNVNLGSNFTISHWIKPVSDRATFRIIFAKGAKVTTPPSGHFETYIDITTGKAAIYVPNLTPTGLVSSSVVDDGPWHLVTFTYNGALLAIYIDGKLDNSVATTGSITPGTTWLAIGPSTAIDATYVGTSPFTGSINNLFVSGIAMTATEARQLYVQPFASLVVNRRPGLNSSPVVFRRTLSPLGTRAGSRQAA